MYESASTNMGSRLWTSPLIYDIADSLSVPLEEQYHHKNLEVMGRARGRCSPVFLFFLMRLLWLLGKGDFLGGEGTFEMFDFPQVEI